MGKYGILIDPSYLFVPQLRKIVLLMVGIFILADSFNSTENLVFELFSLYENPGTTDSLSSTSEYFLMVFIMHQGIIAFLDPLSGSH